VDASETPRRSLASSAAVSRAQRRERSTVDGRRSTIPMTARTIPPSVVLAVRSRARASPSSSSSSTATTATNARWKRLSFEDRARFATRATRGGGDDDVGETTTTRRSSGVARASPTEGYASEGASGSRRARRAETKPPVAQRALTKFLELPAVPIGSFVSSPTSPLHRMDARLKQAWLGALLVLPASGSPEDKLATCAALVLVSAAALPRRVWQPQLKSLGAVCLLFFVAVAIGADSVAPVVSAREPPASLEGLEGLPELATSYRYVLFHLGPLQLTRKGINLAVTSSAMTFTVLQSAHLALCVTTPEAMAAGLRWYLSPLRALKVPVEEIIFTLLLSLRFTSIVFEEVRNLSLGLAARDVDWRSLGWRGSVDIFSRLLTRLLDSMFANAAAISDAVNSRGYRDAKTHRLILSGRKGPGMVENVVGIAGLVLFVGHFNQEWLATSLDAYNTSRVHALSRG
jgi:energy-coupling factor transporter transmembrane protein EcfT